MLTKSPPQRRSALLSAFDENLGPSIETIVAPTWTLIPISLAAIASISHIAGWKAGSIGTWQTPVGRKKLLFIMF